MMIIEQFDETYSARMVTWKLDIHNLNFIIGRYRVKGLSSELELSQINNID